MSSSIVSKETAPSSEVGSFSPLFATVLLAPLYQEKLELYRHKKLPQNEASKLIGNVLRDVRKLTNNHTLSTYDIRHMHRLVVGYDLSRLPLPILSHEENAVLIANKDKGVVEWLGL